MIWTVIPLAAIVIAYVVLTQPGKQPMNTVNPKPDFRYASSQTGVTYPQPRGLPAHWRATHSKVSRSGSNGPMQVEVGYLTAANQYAQLVESTRALGPLLKKQVGDRTAQGRVAVDGRSWDRYRTGRGEIALAGSIGKLSVVVSGSAKLPELRALVAALG